MLYRKDQEVASVDSTSGASQSKRKSNASDTTIAPPSKKQRVVSGKGVESFSDHDVLSGRGGGTNLHPGNRFYRDLILMNREKYDIASKAKKPDVARQIVQMIRQSGGRFLRKDKDGLYYDIGDESAREKTSQALRHRTFEMRNQADARAKQQRQQEPTKQQDVGLPKTIQVPLPLLPRKGASGTESPTFVSSSRLPPLVLQDALSLSDRGAGDLPQDLRLQELARIESEVQQLRQQNLVTLGNDSETSQLFWDTERSKLLQLQQSIRQESAELESLLMMGQRRPSDTSMGEQLNAANRSLMMSAVGRDALLRQQQQQRDMVIRHQLASLSASSMKAGLPFVSPFTLSSFGVNALR